MSIIQPLPPGHPGSSACLWYPNEPLLTNPVGGKEEIGSVACTHHSWEKSTPRPSFSFLKPPDAFERQLSVEPFRAVVFPGNLSALDLGHGCSVEKKQSMQEWRHRINISFLYLEPHCNASLTKANVHQEKKKNE